MQKISEETAEGVGHTAGKHTKRIEDRSSQRYFRFSYPADTLSPNEWDFSKKAKAARSTEQIALGPH